MSDYRIEAATKEEWANRALVAEAKLAKAVEALREIAGSVPYADNPWHIALAALAELEGGGERDQKQGG
jgi:hypothetical protein